LKLLKKLPKLRIKMLQVLFAIAILGIISLSFLIPYSINKRDIANIEQEAYTAVALIKSGLLSVMMNTGDQTEIRNTVDKFKEVKNFEFRMVRSKYVQSQYGVRDGEIPKDEIEENIMNGNMSEYIGLSGDSLRLLTPFFSDETCQKCHHGLNDEPIPPGKVIGVAEFIFDLKERNHEAREIVYQIAFEVAVLFILLSVGFYRLLSRHIIYPINRIAGAIELIKHENFNAVLPEPRTEEIGILVDQVQNTAQILKTRKIERDIAIEEERKFNEEIRIFALEHADSIGIKDKDDAQWIVNRFSEAAKKYKSTELIEAIYDFVDYENKSITLPNDPVHIMPTTLFLTSLLPDRGENVKKRSVELAVEEAITNAIVHGNLEVPSKLKDESFEKFNAMFNERRQAEPYMSRKVLINYHYENRRAVYSIKDEGPGFDWKYFLKKEDVDDIMQTHGRGIILIRTFASGISFNEKGNQITLSFDL